MRNRVVFTEAVPCTHSTRKSCLSGWRETPFVQVPSRAKEPCMGAVLHSRSAVVNLNRPEQSWQRQHESYTYNTAQRLVTSPVTDTQLCGNMCHSIQEMIWAAPSPQIAFTCHLKITLMRSCQLMIPKL